MYNILIFGDSIAAGRKVEKIKSWPYLLVQHLDNKDKDFTLVHNLSIPGDSTNEVIKRFPVEAEARCKKNYPDDRSTIIFAVGLNDAKCLESRDNSVTSRENFTNNIGVLIGNAKKYTDRIMFIGLTPVDERKTAPIDNTYFLNAKIEAYEKILAEECKKRNISFLSIFEELLKSDYTSLLSKDGVHPTEGGHQIIFEKVKSLFI